MALRKTIHHRDSSLDFDCSRKKTRKKVIVKKKIKKRKFQGFRYYLSTKIVGASVGVSDGNSVGLMVGVAVGAIEGNKDGVDDEKSTIETSSTLIVFIERPSKFNSIEALVATKGTE
jgi:hypothetical protein